MKTQRVIHIKRMAILLMSLACFASCRHLTFKEIPLNGSIERFEKRVVKKGITKNVGIEKDSIGVASKGSFTCDFYGDTSIEAANISEVNVEATPNSGEVFKIIVKNKNEKYDGNVINDIKEFHKRVDLLTELYGDPDNRHYDINDKEERIGDGTPMPRIEIDTITPSPGKYVASFTPKQGNIEVELMITSAPKSRITMTYLDNKNNKQLDKEKIKAKKEYHKRLLKQF